jgi:hypothetical protein
MPWCEPCSRFLSPATVTADGRCPACGRPVEAGRARAPAASVPAAPSASAAAPAPAPAAVDREGLPPIPWHFKVLCAAATIYLGWRAVQGVEWLASRL